MRHLCLFCLFLITSNLTLAQSPPVACQDFFQPPAAFCAATCIACDLDGYGSTNQWFPQWDAPPQFCAPQFNSINWVGFIAGTPSIDLLIPAYNCQQGDGLQAGIFGTTDCNSFTQVSNCDPGFANETYLSAQGLVPGHVYYLVIDGVLADICDFEVVVASGSTQAPPVFGDPVIVGEDDICAGGQATYFVDGVFGAGYYNWELNGAPIGQEDYITLSGLPTGSYELCATPGNPCFGDGQTACKTISAFPPPPVVLNEEVCFENLPYFYQNLPFTSSGVYNFTTSDPQGCDQYVLLNLTVLGPNPPTEVFADICKGFGAYYIGGQVFTMSGYYTVLLLDQNGCDSIINLHLDAHLPVFTPLGVVTAELPFIVGGVTVDTTGDFSILFTDQYGCDSIVSGFLAALSPDTIFTDTTICQGDTVFYNMQPLTSSGVYFDTLINMDTATIQQLTLTVIPAGSDTLAAAICEGNSLNFGGANYTLSGVYCDTIPGGGAGGCDSIHCLNLIVLPTDTTFLDTAICVGESIIIGNSIYTAPGQYTYLLTAVNGCDSIVVITLEVLPVQETFLNEQICEGETYPFGGDEYSQPGQYTEVFPSNISCDSVVMLNLSVIPVVETALDTTLCPGQALFVGPYILREPFQGELQFNGANGCDSVLNLSIAYYDTIRVDTVIIEPDDEDFFGGSIYVELTGGTPPYSYQWSDGRTEPFLDFLPSGRYFLMAADAHCAQGFLFKVPLRNELGTGPVIRRTGPGGGGIIVSPNPFSQEMEVKVTGIDEGQPTCLLLYNFAGQLVHEERASGISHRLRPQVPAGVYWLVVEQEGARIGVEKVICVRR